MGGLLRTDADLGIALPRLGSAPSATAPAPAPALTPTPAPAPAPAPNPTLGSPSPPSPSSASKGGPTPSPAAQTPAPTSGSNGGSAVNLSTALSPNPASNASTHIALSGSATGSISVASPASGSAAGNTVPPPDTALATDNMPAAPASGLKAPAIAIIVLCSIISLAIAAIALYVVRRRRQQQRQQRVAALIEEANTPVALRKSIERWQSPLPNRTERLRPLSAAEPVPAANECEQIPADDVWDPASLTGMAPARPVLWIT